MLGGTGAFRGSLQDGMGSPRGGTASGGRVLHTAGGVRASLGGMGPGASVFSPS